MKPVYTEATKQMQLWTPPRILTLHLKRFEQVGRGLRKVNKHIEFPLELDLSPFCLKNDMVSLPDASHFASAQKLNICRSSHCELFHIEVRTRTCNIYAMRVSQ